MSYVTSGFKADFKKTGSKVMAERAEQDFQFGLNFGTAGIRAVMGEGGNRLNSDTISIITQGLASYLLKCDSNNGVVIGYDCRNNSKQFAETTAKTLAGNGIRSYLFNHLVPTPLVSFAVRRLAATAGVNITASHNTAEYNGYKVYWEDGAQVIYPHDIMIIDEINNVSSLKDVKIASIDSELITRIEESVIDEYLEKVVSGCVSTDFTKKHGKTISIIYSPLHGTGIVTLPKALKMAGFENVIEVEEQKEVDGNFTNAKSPNPESKQTLEYALRDLKKFNGDIALVSDPDADRLSLSVMKNGIPTPLSGNETGILILDHLINNRKLEQGWSVISTIVSSRLIKKITEESGGAYFDVLTGFKYIGEKIQEWENNNNPHKFLFGMEESMGYLHNTFVRDKDATNAACIIAELTTKLKLLGGERTKTPLHRLYEIYEQFGIYREGQITIELEGKPDIVDHLKTKFKSSICGQNIVSTEDYVISKGWLMNGKKEWILPLPKTNMLIFKLENNDTIIIRPSGTEPKLKIYMQVSAQKPTNHIETSISHVDDRIKSWLEQIKSNLQ